MKIKNQSILTGKVYEREISLTLEEWEEIKKGERLIQDIVPHLSTDDREFLISGIPQEEWKKLQ